MAICKWVQPMCRQHALCCCLVNSVICVVCRAGCYCLQYSLLPELPGGRTLRFSIDLQVTAGPPVSFDIRVSMCFCSAAS